MLCDSDEYCENVENKRPKGKSSLLIKLLLSDGPTIQQNLKTAPPSARPLAGGAAYDVATVVTGGTARLPMSRTRTELFAPKKIKTSNPGRLDAVVKRLIRADLKGPILTHKGAVKSSESTFDSIKAAPLNRPMKSKTVIKVLFNKVPGRNTSLKGQYSKRNIKNVTARIDATKKTRMGGKKRKLFL